MSTQVVLTLSDDFVEQAGQWALLTQREIAPSLGRGISPCPAMPTGAHACGEPTCRAALSDATIS